MRIGLIYDRFVRGGGLENYLSDFSCALAAQGHEPQIITSQTDKETEAYGFEIHRIPPRGSGGSRMKNFAADAAERTRNLPLDVSLGFGRTYAHDIHRAGGGCHAVYCKTALPSHKRLRPKNWAELALEKKLYTSGETSHFVVNSAMVRDQIAETYALSLSRISVIHTAVDLTAFRPPSPPDRDGGKAAICKELGSDPSVPVFLFVSLNHQRKGLAPLLQALGETQAHLWVMGSPLSAAQRATIDRTAIGKRVFHIEKTSEPAPYYRAADFFIHPTQYDACANTVLQAMASGLPSIISTRDGAREFIDDGENGFLLEAPDSHEAISELISKATSLSPESYESFSKAARKSVSSLSWNKHIRSWLQLFESLDIKSTGSP